MPPSLPPDATDADCSSVRFLDGPPLMLALVVAVAFWLLRALEQTGDSLVYATTISTGHDLLHPHHLLFSPIVHGVHVATGLDAISAAQLHNVLWAAFAVLATRYAFARLLGSRSLATWIAAGTAASAGFLNFSSQCEVYVPALAATLVTFALLASRDRISAFRLVLGGLMLALSILYHQAMALNCIAVIILASRGGLRSGFAVVGVAGASCLIAYLVAYTNTAAQGSLSGFWRYCVSYAVVENPDWGSWNNVDAKGLYLLADSQARNLVHVIGDEFSRSSMFASVTLTLALATAALLALRAVRRGELPPRVAAFLGSWGLAHWAFALWWLPREEEFLIVTTPVAIAFAGIAIRHRSSAAATAAIGRPAWLALAVIAAWNVGVGALPRHLDEGDHARLARSLTAVTDDGTVILVDFRTFGSYSWLRGAGSAYTVDPLFRSLQRDADKVPVDLRHASRVVVPLRLIDPSISRWRPTNAATKRDWLRIVRWIACLATTEPDAQKTHGRLRLIDTAAGAILEVEPRHRVPGNLEQVIDRLDHLDDGGGRYRAAYASRY